SASCRTASTSSGTASHSRCARATDRRVVTGRLGRGGCGRSCPPGDLLYLRVLLHAPAPAFAPDAALFEATEWAVEHVDAVVDPHHAGADALGQRDRPAGVAGVDGAAQTVRGLVGDTNRLVLVLERNDGHHRTEDLLARDALIVAHVAEQGGLEEVAAREVLGTAAAGGQRGALPLAGRNVLLDLLPALVADDGAEHRRRVRRVADLHHALEKADHVLHEGVVHRVGHQ